MEYLFDAYAIYLAVSVVTTIGVAWTLHRNGRIFLVDAFHGNEKLADSVNHLLVVGFYLLNIGFVALGVKYGYTEKPNSMSDAFEFVSTKIGLVLVILGVMHLFNLYVFSRMRRRAMLRNVPPPVAPQEYVKIHQAA